MRKKYLSALLFGALLFASAGTFTSCKDYDDDIDNLQSQIDKVVSDLASLKSTVDNLNVGVTSVTVDGDQLVVVTNGATTKMNLPVGVQVSEIEIKNGHLYVGGVDKGAIDAPATPTEKAQKVEVKEDGFLYIDDVKQDGLHVGTDVVIKDASNGIYTITIGKETIQLPMASSAINYLELTTGYTVRGKYAFSADYLSLSPFTESGYGINWGKAGSAIDNWTGPLGAIAKGQTLIGAINGGVVTVSPATFDLSTVTLTLVDTKGNVAPATIRVSPKNNQSSESSGSRAADIKGEWNLSITPTADASTLGTAYTAADGKNALYALAADGKVLSAYEIIVDTWTNTESANNTAAPAFVTSEQKLYIGNVRANTMGATSSGVAPVTIANVPLGDSKIIYKDASIADFQVDINAASIDDAELLGITLDKTTNTLHVSDKAAGVSPALGHAIMLDIKTLGVNGKVSSNIARLTLTSFAKINVNDKVTLATTEYKVANNKPAVIINMGDVFTGLTAAEATSLDKNSIKWKYGDNNGADNFLVNVTNATNDRSLGLSATVTYYASESDAKNGLNGIILDDDTPNSQVRTIKYAKIAIANYNTTATKGEKNLTLDLVAETGTIKKVVAPINITLPTFDELFEKSAAWNATGDVLTLRLDQTGKAKMMTAYKTSLITASAATANQELIVTFNTIDGADVVATSTMATVNNHAVKIQKNTDLITIAGAAIDGSTHKLKALTAKSSYKVAGVNGFEVESDKYTVNLITPLEGAQIVHYVDGVATAIETNPGTTLTIGRLPVDAIQVSGADKDGFAFVLNGKDYIIGGTSTAVSAGSDGQIGMIHRYSEENKASGWSVDNIISTAIDYNYSFDSKAGNDATISLADNKLTIKDLAEPSIGTTEYTTTGKVIVKDVKLSGGAYVQTALEVPVTVKK